MPFPEFGNDAHRLSNNPDSDYAFQTECVGSVTVGSESAPNSIRSKASRVQAQVPHLS
jgi:hypothetical protein